MHLAICPLLSLSDLKFFSKSLTVISRCLSERIEVNSPKDIRSHLFIPPSIIICLGTPIAFTFPQTCLTLSDGNRFNRLNLKYEWRRSEGYYEFLDFNSFIEMNENLTFFLVIFIDVILKDSLFLPFLFILWSILSLLSMIILLFG